MVRKSLQGRTSNEVAFAAIAVYKWAQLSLTPRLPQVDRLVARLVVIVESGRTIGLQQLLWVARQLTEEHFLSKEQIATLVEAITNIFDVNDYWNINPNGQEAVVASILREECVKLADLFNSRFYPSSLLVDLLEKGKSDALPEVRYALSS